MATPAEALEILKRGTVTLHSEKELADKLARRIVLLGEDEVASGVLTVKSFATGEQRKVERAELVAFCRSSRFSLRELSERIRTMNTRCDLPWRESK